VARVDQLQLAGGDVDVHRLCCDEAVGSERLGDGVVHERILLGQADERAPGMAVGANREGRRRGGVQAVAHCVDYDRVQDAVVEGVVEAVAGDPVGGFQHAGDSDLWDMGRTTAIGGPPSAGAGGASRVRSARPGSARASVPRGLGRKALVVRLVDHVHLRLVGEARP
jgi:hypothetical protein